MTKTTLFFLKWLLTLGVVVGLFVLAFLIHQAAKDSNQSERGRPDERASEKESDALLKFNEANALAHGLQFAKVESVDWQEELPIYGRVVPNPRATFEVRAAAAGILRSDPGNPWPVLGQWLVAERLNPRVLGWIDVRVDPEKRLDLEMRHAEASLRERSAEEVFKIRDEQLRRLKPDTVSVREYEDARVQLTEAQLQLNIARDNEQRLRRTLGEIDHPGERPSLNYSRPLLVLGTGEVTEVLGQPGTAVEAGAVIFRVLDLGRPLVRLDVPLSALAAGPLVDYVDLKAQKQDTPALRGATNQPELGESLPAMRARPIGPVAQIDPTSQYAGYWFELVSGYREGVATLIAGAAAGRQSPGSAVILCKLLQVYWPGVPAWRPGRFVQTTIKPPQSSSPDAVAVPASAVLYHQGRALVYVRLPAEKEGGSRERYARREVRILGRQDERVILAAREILDREKVGVAAGEEVVSAKAQVLLSEEFRSDVDVD